MKFNIGDKLHISGDITVTGANKCGDGIYSYSTEVGTFHEPALEKLVCKTASVKPQEPKFYSGKVVCVEARCPLTNSFTAGKVYTFENGKVADNDGDARPLDDAMETLAGWNEEHGGIAKFIEYKGKAT